MMSRTISWQWGTLASHYWAKTMMHLNDFVLNSTPPKRGRPYLISEDALMGRFSEVVGFLENCWADVAWDLQRSRTLPAIRAVLQKVRRESFSEYSHFIYEPTQKTTPQQIGELRKEIKRTDILHRLAIDEERLASERLHPAIHATKDNPKDSKLQVLLRKREQQYASAQNQLKVVSDQSNELRQALRCQEAYIAQSELLDFIASSRYTLSPRNYAAAMAGLPFITWRRSATRLGNYARDHKYGLEYEKFRVVFRALHNPPTTASKAEAAVKAALLKSREHNSSVQILKKEWHYLHAAIKGVYETNPRKTAIPFRVYAEYQHRTSRRGPYDLLMEEEERL